MFFLDVARWCASRYVRDFKPEARLPEDRSHHPVSMPAYKQHHHPAGRPKLFAVLTACLTLLEWSSRVVICVDAWNSRPWPGWRVAC